MASADTTTTTTTTGVSKLEEKKFRKDIQVFLEDASKLTDPQVRMQELTEILSYFQDGTAADLRESVEKQINGEKEKLEKLIQEAQKTQETFGTAKTEDLKAGVALLAEEVRVASAEAKDWEAIAVVFKEKNDVLKTKIEEAQKELATRPAATLVEELNKQIKRLQLQRERLVHAHTEELKNFEEKAFSASSRIKIAEARIADLEKASALKEADLKKKEVILAEQSTKVSSLTEATQQTKAAAEKVVGNLKEAVEKIVALESQVTRLQTEMTEATAAKVTLQTEFDAFKAKIEEEKTPKLQPRYEERSKGYFNFNEAGVENYWTDLVARHGAAMKPFERQIRGAKTIKEASTMYLKLLPSIDEDAAAADEARLSESARFTKEERKEYLEEAGMKFGQAKDILDRNSSWAN